MVNPFAWAFDNIMDKVWEASGYVADNWSSVFEDWDEFTDTFNSVAQETFSAFFSFLSSSLGFFLRFLFDFIFVDIFESCHYYGSQILNYFFSSYASKPFDFVYIEAVVGFIFVIFCLRLIISVIRW